MATIDIKSISITPQVTKVLNKIFPGFSFQSLEEDHCIFKQHHSNYVRVSHSIVNYKLNKVLHKQVSHKLHLPASSQTSVNQNINDSHDQIDFKLQDQLDQYHLWDREFQLIDYQNHQSYTFVVQDTPSPESYFTLTSEEGTQRVAHYSVLQEAQNHKLQQDLKSFERQIDLLSPAEFVEQYLILHTQIKKITHLHSNPHKIQTALTRILYHWYERLNDSTYLSLLLEEANAHLLQLLSVEEESFQYIGQEKRCLDLHHRSVIRQKLKDRVTYNQLYADWSNMLQQTSAYDYLHFFKVIELVEALKTDLDHPSCTQQKLQQRLQKHANIITTYCKDTIDLKRFSLSTHTHNINHYLECLMALQKHFVKHQLRIGIHDQAMIRQFHAQHHSQEKDTINIFFSREELTHLELKELLEDLVEYRLTLLFNTQITDPYFKRMAYYDAISFYHQYYIIIQKKQVKQSS